MTGEEKGGKKGKNKRKKKKSLDLLDWIRRFQALQKGDARGCDVCVDELFDGG